MKKHIVFAFSLVFLVYCLGSAAMINNLLQSTTNLQNLINLHEIEDIRQNLNLRVQKIQAFVHLSALDFSYNLDEIVANISGMDKAVQACYNCHHAPAVKKELDYTAQLMNDYQAKLSFLITSGRDDDWRKDNQQQAGQIASTITFHVQDMVNRAAATLQRKTDAVMLRIRRTYLFLGGTLLGSLVVMGFIARHLTTKILTPVNQLLVATQRLTDGELGYTTESRGDDEFSKLQHNFNAMSLSLAQKEKENQELTQALHNKIAELNRTQQQLIISEKLASLGKLAGGIAHDFNNILCGILSYINLLKQQLRDNAEATDLLITIEKASHHAAQLVSKLRSFAGQKEWLREPINCNEVVIAVHQAIMRTFDQEFHVELTLEKDLALVRGDFAGLQELLYSVCENAVEALVGKGLLTIVTENCTGPSTPGGTESLVGKPCVKISIRDNGKGIRAEDVPKVFDPYFSTRQLCAQRGIGLGMAIAFSIVKQHNGYIDIDSKEGEGTQVDIYLPSLTTSDSMPQVKPQPA